MTHLRVTVFRDDKVVELAMKFTVQAIARSERRARVTGSCP